MTSPFFVTSMSMSELRQPTKLIDHLKADPYLPVSLERYNATEGVVLSPELWQVLMGLVTGATRVFHVPSSQKDAPLDGPPPKLVVATRKQTTLDVFDVFVDWMPYTLELSNDDVTQPEPDYTQLLWKHHADVATQLVAYFLSSP